MTSSAKIAIELRSQKDPGWVVVKPYRSTFTIVYLARSADAFPEREVADNVDGEQAECHVPLDGAQVVQALAALQLQDGAAADQIERLILTLTKKKSSANYRNFIKF